MPEGDTIHRTAAVLRTALIGRPTVRFDAPRLQPPYPGVGRVVESVEAHGKHLEIVWDDDSRSVISFADLAARGGVCQPMRDPALLRRTDARDG